MIPSKIAKPSLCGLVRSTSTIFWIWLGTVTGAGTSLVMVTFLEQLHTSRRKAEKSRLRMFLKEKVKFIKWVLTGTKLERIKKSTVSWPWILHSNFNTDYPIRFPSSSHSATLPRSSGLRYMAAYFSGLETPCLSRTFCGTPSHTLAWLPM